MNKKIIITFILFLSFASLEVKSKECDMINYIPSDSIWLQDFRMSYNNSIEISEICNEYLFCRLESNDCYSFILFLYLSLTPDDRNRIEYELQHPVEDIINIDLCIQNVVLSSSVEESFKNWLITNLLQSKPNNYFFLLKTCKLSHLYAYPFGS